MVQRCVSTQCLRKGTNSGNLSGGNTQKAQVSSIKHESLLTHYFRILFVYIRLETQVNAKCTLVWIILCGMAFMALLSQPSRLLAKLRMAWVKAPGATTKQRRQKQEKKQDTTVKLEASTHIMWAREVCVSVTHWEWVSGHQEWGSLQGPGTWDGHRCSSISARPRFCTAPGAASEGVELRSH